MLYNLAVILLMTEVLVGEPDNCQVCQKEEKKKKLS